MARSIAEHYRHHRAAFLLAQQLGCTPRQAEAELRRRAAWEKLESTQARLRAQAERRAAEIAARMAPEPEPRNDQPWMMRD